MQRNLSLLSMYWGMKPVIHYDSLWFRNKIVYPQWHTASDISVEMALKTGAQIQPEEVRNHNWIESEIESVNSVCFEKLCVETDFKSIYTYPDKISSMSYDAAKSDTLEVWVTYVDGLQNKVLSIFTKENKGSLGADVNLMAAVVECMIGIYISMVIGANNYLESMDSAAIYANAKRHTSFSEIDLQSNRFANNKRIESLYEAIESEIAIENKRITPDWFIEQTVAQSIYNYLNRRLKALMILHKNITEVGDHLLSSELYFEAMVAYSKLPELERKLERSIELLALFIPALLEKREKILFGTIIAWKISKNKWRTIKSHGLKN